MAEAPDVKGSIQHVILDVRQIPIPPNATSINASLLHGIAEIVYQGGAALAFGASFPPFKFSRGEFEQMLAQVGGVDGVGKTLSVLIYLCPQGYAQKQEQTENKWFFHTTV
jgi:hypothetical protein